MTGNQRTFSPILPMILASVAATCTQAQGPPASADLPTPGFHHLHLNTVDPETAIEFYTRNFPSTHKSYFAGSPALKAGDVYILFTKVDTPPPTEPQTAIWHFGWHVVDVHRSYEIYRQRKDVHLFPLYTSDEGGYVFVSSDTWPGADGSLGRTKAQIAEAKAKGIQPVGGAGFAYLEGPDGAIIEYQGNMPVERFNHVHLFQEQPFCAQLWYHKHLNAPLPPEFRRTETDCKVGRPEPSWPSLERDGMFRLPASVVFGEVALTWHIQQNDRPLVSSRGHLADHIGLSVTSLDGWIAKFRREGIKFVKQPYRLGDARAVMIEGPSRELLELVEVK